MKVGKMFRLLAILTIIAVLIGCSAKNDGASSNNGGAISGSGEAGSGNNAAEDALEPVELTVAFFTLTSQTQGIPEVRRRCPVGALRSEYGLVVRQSIDFVCV